MVAGRRRTPKELARPSDGERQGVEAMPITGTVKFFNNEKGFGFIQPDDGSRDVFVHVSAVTDSGIGSLAEGQRISFDVEPDKRGKGPKAINLKPA